MLLGHRPQIGLLHARRGGPRAHCFDIFVTVAQADQECWIHNWRCVGEKKDRAQKGKNAQYEPQLFKFACSGAMGIA